MKKIMVIILLGLTCVTMYFVVLWEPSTTRTSSEEVSVEKNEVEIEEKSKEKSEESTKKEREKEEKKKREEFEENEKIKKEKNKKSFLEFKNNLKEEEKKVIDKKMSILSTVDLMKVEEFLNNGDLKQAIDLMKLRMLESDWKAIYEILNKNDNLK